jgi:hypothetical protein
MWMLLLRLPIGRLLSKTWFGRSAVNITHILSSVTDFRDQVPVGIAELLIPF